MRDWLGKLFLKHHHLTCTSLRFCTFIQKKKINLQNILTSTKFILKNVKMHNIPDSQIDVFKFDLGHHFYSQFVSTF